MACYNLIIYITEQDTKEGYSFLHIEKNKIRGDEKMAEGENSREIVDGMENAGKRANNIIDAGLNKALSNNAAFNDLVDKSADKLKENAINNKEKKDALKNRLMGGKNKSGGAKKAAEAAKGATENVGKAANTAKGIATGGGNPTGMITDKAINAAGGPQMDESKSSGEMVNKMDNAVKEGVKTAALAARAAAGDGAAATELALKLGKTALKIILIVLTVIVGFFFFLIASIIILMGNIISSAITHISEAFDVVSQALNPTAIESFTMEDQYGMLAVAFGTSVMDAYKRMEDEVINEINQYDVNPVYNEWSDILAYNKSKGKITYDTIVRRSSESHSMAEIGMPQNEAGSMVNVYIGGYTGTISDENFEPDSTKLGHYDKGLYKKDSTEYATGNEPYFDLDGAIDAIRSESAYAAVSDMSYLIAGYTVSMNEDPIIDLGKKVSKLQYGLTVIGYTMDIQERLFQQGMHTTESMLFSGNYISASKEFLKTVFAGESTYFKYDPGLIKQISTSKSRWVYEYCEGQVVPCYDYTFTYKLSYDYDDTDAVECTNPSCPDYSATSSHSHDEPVTKSGSSTVTITYSRQDDIDRVTRESYTAPTASDFDADAIALAPEGAYNVSITDRSESKSNEIYVNRSGYDLVEKHYNSWTLDIPMEAFDVDRMMKAIFETNAYWGELTGYYTDRNSTYSYIPGETPGYSPEYIDQASGQDEILNYYGKYIPRWKYAYYEETWDYGSAPAGKVTYREGDLFDNGIDKQPYFQYDEVYLYACNCTPNYGIPLECPKCGSKVLQRSGEISSSGTSSGWGNRPLTSMTSPLVNDNAFFRFFDFLSGGSVAETLKKNNQEAKQKLMVVMTTTSKLVIDDYTGGQVGGNLGSTSMEVVLTKTNADGTTYDYYPITVHDRILELKNSALNVLENSEYIQNLLAKTGLTYTERLSSDNSNWKSLLEHLMSVGSFGTQGIDVTPLSEYIRDKLVHSGSYTYIGRGKLDEVEIGMGKWTGTDANKIVSEAKNQNPDKYQKLLEDNGITGSQFDIAWKKLYMDDYPNGVPKSSVMNVLSGLLGETQSIQNQMYNEKVKEITVYLENNCQVTDPATLLLLGGAIMEMGIEDPHDISKKGEFALFNQNVIIGSISAGADNSFKTAYENLKKWLGSGNPYATPSLMGDINNMYNTIMVDKIANNLPWIYSNGDVPQELTDMLDYLDSFISLAGTDSMKSYTHYSQGRAADGYPRMIGEDLIAAIDSFVATGNTHVSTDCSAFVYSIFQHLGYKVPSSSLEWATGAAYAGRTDWSNIQPGDVVVWRNSSGGHVEIYVGPGATESIGFGSAPPKHRSSWSWHDDYYGASNRKFYRVIN